MWKTQALLSLLILALAINTVNSNQCLTMLEEVNPKRIVQLEGQSLNIQFEISNRVTQRLVTKVMRIFLQEVLGYPNVKIVEKEDEFDVTGTFARLSENLTNSRKSMIPESMVNMEVWIPPHLDTVPLLSKYDVTQLGPIAPPGHFGWFVPDRLSRINDSWITFTKQETAARFDVDDINLSKIMNATMSADKQYYCQESFCQNGMYIPPQCQSSKHKSQPCAMLLAEYSGVTKFIKHHIDHWKLYVNVAWVGPNLKHIIKSLTKEYLLQAQNSAIDKSLAILHWTPSNILPNEREFVTIEFPRCGSKNSTEGCQYETTKLEKLVWNGLEPIAKVAFEAINRAQYSQQMYENLISKYNEKLMNQLSHAKISLIEQEVACDWLKENLNYTLLNWMPNDEDKNTLIVGGIFPMTGTFYTARSIVLAAQMAKNAINHNKTILRDYNFKMLINDGQCKSDLVMKSFIDYILHNYYSKLIGVLGPACSETIEPLAGVSKHFYTVIMSYGAEGSSFSDRSRYPYFFRTIGENRQYKYVYLELLKKLNWHRVAAFSEDGLKYTEYISYMQDMLRENGITFVANIKFPREWQPDILTKYLEDLKQKRARIIISDVYDQVARLVMCEAYKLEMTAAQGYVWFLPLWLHPNWFNTDYYNERGENTPCNTTEMEKAIEGHLGISHANFAPDDSIMQEGITVREWRNKYESYCAKQNVTTSTYAGYTYDAMWTYAYAVDKLLSENQSYIFDLHSEHTVTRFTDIISKTDFNGVSGRIKFVGGPSRFPVINIYQHVDGETRLVGNFHPNISEEMDQVIGGTLDLNTSSIVWLSGKKPDDGSEPPKTCVFSGLAELLNISCEGAIILINFLAIGILLIPVAITVVVVKRKYKKKCLEQKKYLESLNLLPRVPYPKDLAEWEVPREHVVINRKIGEGAFGTVYGGETFSSDKGWLAVAVKTLKPGSTIEEKVDFLSEVEVMKKFDHKNIIKLVGVCIKSEPVLTVMEFMLYGDLKTYLLARRHLVNDRHYEDSDEISNKKLTAMALDVARALSYLAENKFVHRDVASRNCLVNAQRVVKLGDFGMTRSMYDNDYYKFSRKGMLPVRWMPPESLALGLFTTATDVWSYGVLLYEIVTFGSFPYQGLSNNQVLEYVKSGLTLSVPKGVKPQLEELMKSCWRQKSSERPAAPEIVEFLATHQRLIAPCLDVPLASVQLELSGQIDIQLNTATNRKFSFPWSAQEGTRHGSRSPIASSDTPLLDMNSDTSSSSPRDQNMASLFGASSTFALDSTRPLLDTTDGTASDLNNTAVRYVNIEPGVKSAFSTEPTADSNTCSIPMTERRTLISGTNNFNNMPF